MLYIDDVYTRNKEFIRYNQISCACGTNGYKAQRRNIWSLCGKRGKGDLQIPAIQQHVISSIYTIKREKRVAIKGDRSFVTIAPQRSCRCPPPRSAVIISQSEVDRKISKPQITTRATHKMSNILVITGLDCCVFRHCHTPLRGISHSKSNCRKVF